MRPFVPAATFRGIFAGSGSDAFNEACICSEAVRLTGKTADDKLLVVYLGTATYDLDVPRLRQTARFAEMGCRVVSATVALPSNSLPTSELEALIARDADIVLVSGGNTLYALDRWRATGVDAFLKEAMDRGCVLAGGSAGAICWFDGGHSDSADPDTFRSAMVPSDKDESGTAPATDAEKKAWSYIRVSGLGFLPGLCCPHHDRTQSNGVPRSDDFDAMLLRHRGEFGIGIDHWAALICEGNSYRVMAVPDKPGPPGGVWLKFVDEGATVVKRAAPSCGHLSELLQYATSIEVDPREDETRAKNRV